jgi:hypothetical protein
VRYTKEQVVAAIKAIDFKSLRQVDHGTYTVSAPPKAKKPRVCKGMFCKDAKKPNAASVKHPCPYQSDINNDDTPCNCCHACQVGCNRET